LTGSNITAISIDSICGLIRLEKAIFVESLTKSDKLEQGCGMKNAKSINFSKLELSVCGTKVASTYNKNMSMYTGHARIKAEIYPKNAKIGIHQQENRA
jgi:hypothetical protein